MAGFDSELLTKNNTSNNSGSARPQIKATVIGTTKPKKNAPATKSQRGKTKVGKLQQLAGTNSAARRITCNTTCTPLLAAILKTACLFLSKQLFNFVSASFKAPSRGCSGIDSQSPLFFCLNVGLNFLPMKHLQHTHGHQFRVIW